jgi:hypothetical protein
LVQSSYELYLLILCINEHKAHFVPHHKQQRVFLLPDWAMQSGWHHRLQCSNNVHSKESHRAIKNTFCNLRNEFVGKLKLTLSFIHRSLHSLIFSHSNYEHLLRMATFQLYQLTACSSCCNLCHCGHSAPHEILFQYSGRLFMHNSLVTSLNFLHPPELQIFQNNNDLRSQTRIPKMKALIRLSKYGCMCKHKRRRSMRLICLSGRH